MQLSLLFVNRIKKQNLFMFTMWPLSPFFLIDFIASLIQMDSDKTLVVIACFHSSIDPSGDKIFVNMRFSDSQIKK